jgi:hypothetical protein
MREVEINGCPPVTTIPYVDGAGRQAIAIYARSRCRRLRPDAPAENPGPAQEALAALVESINFFNPADAVGESTWQTVSAAGGLVSFPVPATWVQTASGEFTLYGPANDTTTFVALGAAQTAGVTKEELADQWLAQLQGSEQNVQVLASEPYYVGNREWHLVVFTYDDAVKMAGLRDDGRRDGLHLRRSGAAVDQLYTDVLRTIDGLAFVSE